MDYVNVLVAISVLLSGAVIFFLPALLFERKKVLYLCGDINKKRQRPLFLYDISSLYRQKIEKKEFLENFFEKLSRLDDYHKSSYFQLDEERQVLERLVTRGMPQAYIEKTQTQLVHRMGGAATGRALSTKKPVVANDMEKDPALLKYLDYGKLGGFISLITIPVLTAKKPYGTIIIYGERKNMFTQEEIVFGQVAANFLSQLLEINEK